MTSAQLSAIQSPGCTTTLCTAHNSVWVHVWSAQSNAYDVFGSGVHLWSWPLLLLVECDRGAEEEESLPAAPWIWWRGGRGRRRWEWEGCPSERTPCSPLLPAPHIGAPTRQHYSGMGGDLHPGQHKVGIIILSLILNINLNLITNASSQTHPHPQPNHKFIWELVWLKCLEFKTFTLKATICKPF